MRLKQVTITGADDSCKVTDLITLQNKYPFVEWAILFSNSKQGTERYPSLPWLVQLENRGLNLSAHLCGSLVRKVVAGQWIFASNWPNLCPFFSRIQLNFSPYLRFLKYDEFINGLKSVSNHNWQIIFQMHTTKSKLIDKCKEAALNVAVLYDLSGGKGVLPEKWAMPGEIYTGYAGGLSPENLKEQLQCINASVGDETIWIDVESHVRTENKFDLNKVESFLQIASQYV